MQWPGTPQGQLQFMADIINTVQRNHGLGVFYWGPEGTRGDGMWSPDGSAAPSIDPGIATSVKMARISGCRSRASNAWSALSAWITT